MTTAKTPKYPPTFQLPDSLSPGPIYNVPPDETHRDIRRPPEV